MTGDGDQWSTYEPSGGRSESERAAGTEPETLPEVLPEVLPPTHVPYGPPTHVTVQVHRGNGGAAVFVAILVLLIAGVTGAVIYFAADDAVQGAFSTPDAPELHTEQGFTDLVSALEDRTGSTIVFRAVVYPGYASIDVPEDDSSARERTLYYNGSFDDDFESLGRSSYGRVDLADVDPAIFTRLLRMAQEKVESPTSTYLIIEGKSDSFDDGALLSAYASNDYSESAYVSATLEGKVVRVYSSVEEEESE